MDGMIGKDFLFVHSLRKKKFRVRHLKQDACASNPIDVIRNDQTFRRSQPQVVLTGKAGNVWEKLTPKS